MKVSQLALALVAAASTTAAMAQGVSGVTTNVMTGAGACLNSTFLTAAGTCAPMAAPAMAAKTGQMAPSMAPSMAPAMAAPAMMGNVMSKGGYVQDGRGAIVRNSSNLCVRTSYWSPALAQPECEGGVAPAPMMAAPAPMMAAPAPVVAPRPAPAPVVAPAPAPAPAPVVAPRPAPVVAAPAPIFVESAPVMVATAPAPAPAPAAPAAPAVTVEKVSFAADAFFDSNKSVLKSEAKGKLDDLASKVQGITLEVIIAVGHTDSDASDAYNQKLSVARAEAVKAYLVTKGIEANRVYTEGKGEKQPVADNKTKEGKAKNRRVEIEVVGTRKK